MIETLKEEAEKMAANGGMFIPPYRLGECVKAASRALEAMMKANITFNYKEIYFVLNIISHACESASGIPFEDEQEERSEQ